MVKGISKRVVVIESPDPKIFEEAIFVVRDDFLHGEGVTQEEILEQARKAASQYIKSKFGRRRMRFSDIPAPAFAAAGAAATGIAWLALRIVGV